MKTFINPEAVEVRVNNNVYYIRGNKNEPALNEQSKHGVWGFNIDGYIRYFDGCYGEARWQAQVAAAVMGIEYVSFWG